MAFNKSNKRNAEVIDPKDIPLTVQEAQAILEVCKIWPKRMGEVLVFDPDKIRWARDPDFSVFVCDWSKIKEDSLLCPVMQVKKLRNWKSFSQHLSAWRSIRNAWAEVKGISLSDARTEYNTALKKNPTEICEVMEQYIFLKFKE